MCVADAAKPLLPPLQVSSAQIRIVEEFSTDLCRDDLTVEVIFFGEGENTGTVTLNKEASASGDVKAKL